MRGVYHGCAENLGPQKMAAIMSSGARVAPRAPKSIDDDVIGCACAVMGLEDDSSVWSYPPAHTTQPFAVFQCLNHVFIDWRSIS